MQFTIDDKKLDPNNVSEGVSKAKAYLDKLQDGSLLKLPSLAASIGYAPTYLGQQFNRGGADEYRAPAHSKANGWLYGNRKTIAEYRKVVLHETTKA